MFSCPVFFLAERLDFGGAAWVVITAHIGIALFLDVVEFEGADRGHLVVAVSVGVPGFGPALEVRMDENHSGGEVVVVVD
jgi:hypothetical protein